MTDIDVVTFAGDWDTLRPEWAELLARSDTESAFLTWEWQSAWWRHFGQGLERRILLAKTRGGRLVGLAPLKIRLRLGVRFLEWIGFGGPAICPDYLDFIVDREFAQQGRQRFLTELTGAMAREWDVAYLSDIPWRLSWLEGRAPGPGGPTVAQWKGDTVPATSGTPAIVAEGLPDLRGGEAWLRPREVCPFLVAGSTMKEFLASRSSHFRDQYRKYCNGLQRKHVIDVRVAANPDEVKNFMENLANLHQLSRSTHDQAGSFRVPGFFEFQLEAATRLLETGRLILMELRADGQPIASWLAFRNGRVTYCYQTGYDPRFNHAGQVSMGYLVELCIERGVRLIDFLRGSHGYKGRWSDGFIETVSCAFPSAHRRGRLAFSLFRRYAALRKLAPFDRRRGARAGVPALRHPAQPRPAQYS